MRPLDRARGEGGAREAHVLAAVLRDVGGEGGLDGADVVVAEPAALVERQPQVHELGLVPTHPDPEDEAAARGLVHGGRGLGRDQRVAVGEHDDAGPQADALRAPREEGEQREGIRPVTAVGLGGGGFGQDVVGDEDAVQPQLLRARRQRLRFRHRELPDGKYHAVLHALLLWGHITSASTISYRSVVTWAPVAADVAAWRRRRASSLARIASSLSQKVTIRPLPPARS